MNMTPKKIISLPVYGSGTTLGLIATILLLPGGLCLAIAMGCYWLADRMSSDTEENEPYMCDMTIEEYERDNDIYSQADRCEDDDTIPVPFIEFENHPEPGFRFTLQQCSNCVYNDACLTSDNSWCDGWEKEQY